jgi:hypothetical protein
MLKSKKLNIQKNTQPLTAPKRNWRHSAPQKDLL